MQAYITLNTYPDSYEFKMCPSCRTRYQKYGNTKRAKWKAEREAFEREMAILRTAEDERRKSEGLHVGTCFYSSAMTINVLFSRLPIYPTNFVLGSYRLSMSRFLTRLQYRQSSQ